MRDTQRLSSKGPDLRIGTRERIRLVRDPKCLNVGIFPEALISNTIALFVGGLFECRALASVQSSNGISLGILSPKGG